MSPLQIRRNLPKGATEVVIIVSQDQNIFFQRKLYTKSRGTT